MKFSIFILLVFYFQYTLADPEPTPIRALIKIELLNGEIKEGIITIAEPSLNYTDYTKNGIYYSNVKEHGILFFDLDMLLIEFNYGQHQIHKISGVNKFSREQFAPFDRASQIKYIQLNHTWSDHKQTYDTSSANILKYSATLTAKYITSDYLAIQTKVNEIDDTLNLVRIPISTIKQISYINNPSDIFLKDISLYHSKLKKLAEKSVDGYVLEPLWYHEIIKDSVLYNLYLLKTKT